jgi:hypothetical protein
MVFYPIMPQVVLYKKGCQNIAKILILLPWLVMVCEVKRKIEGD